MTVSETTKRSQKSFHLFTSSLSCSSIISQEQLGSTRFSPPTTHIASFNRNANSHKYHTHAYAQGREGKGKGGGRRQQEGSAEAAVAAALAGPCFAPPTTSIPDQQLPDKRFLYNTGGARQRQPRATATVAKQCCRGIGSTLVSYVSLQKLREWAARIDVSTQTKMPAGLYLSIDAAYPEGRGDNGVFNGRLHLGGPVRRGGGADG